ncbi:MAG: hypothetical protein AABX89_01775 [Candidatus Thermoplasmatota archaeon]
MPTDSVLLNFYNLQRPDPKSMLKLEKLASRFDGEFGCRPEWDSLPHSAEPWALWVEVSNSEPSTISKLAHNLVQAFADFLVPAEGILECQIFTMDAPGEELYAGPIDELPAIWSLQPSPSAGGSSALNWPLLAKLDYSEFRSKLWPVLEEVLPDSGSVRNGGIDNLLFEAFDGEWKIPFGMLAGNQDYNNLKAMRVAFRGEIEGKLEQRLSQTFETVRTKLVAEGRAKPPTLGGLDHILAKQGIRLNRRDAKRLYEFLKESLSC